MQPSHINLTFQALHHLAMCSWHFPYISLLTAVINALLVQWITYEICLCMPLHILSPLPAMLFLKYSFTGWVQLGWSHLLLPFLHLLLSPYSSLPPPSLLLATALFLMASLTSLERP